MGDFEIRIHSPRILCECGKTVRAMTAEEREDYDHALRTEERTTEIDTATDGSKEVFPIACMEGTATPD